MKKKKIYQNKDWLHKKYIEEKLSAAAIGRICDVQSKRICLWLRKLNFKIKPGNQFITGRPKLHGDASNGQGMPRTRLYSTWLAMKKRCYYSKDVCFNRYGGRGIIICLEWKNNYNAFKFWAILNDYQDDLTIDHIDNDGNYEPNNCQFLTLSENSRKRGKINYEKENIAS